MGLKSLLVAALFGVFNSFDLPVYADICIIRVYGDHTAVVKNPQECSDRELVLYLNCQNTLTPRQYQPKECQ